MVALKMFRSNRGSQLMPKGFSKRRNKYLVDFAYFNWDSPAIERQSVRAVSHCDALRAAKSGLRAQGIDESHLRSALVRRHLRRQWKIVSDDYENPNNAAGVTAKGFIPE